MNKSQDNRPPSYNFYVKDWLTSKKRALMSLECQAAYINLLAHCWDTDDCCLPEDSQTLAALSELRGDWEKHEAQLRSCFTPASKNGFITNERLFKEFAERMAFKRLKKLSGKKGGLASGLSRRKLKGIDSEANVKHSLSSASVSLEANVKQNEALQSSVFSLQSSIKNTPTPLVLSPEELADRFNAIAGVKPVSLSDGKLPDTIREQARRRIKAHNSIEFWDGFLKLIEQSAFLTGKVHGRNGEKPFRASFVWIMGPKNFDKILAGTYTEQGASVNDTARSLRLDGTGRFSVMPDGTKKRILIT